MERFDIAVAGNGLAGRIAAIALSRLGYSVALIGPPPENQDGRTTGADGPVHRLSGRPWLLGQAWPEICSAQDHADHRRHRPALSRANRSLPRLRNRLDAFGYNFPNIRQPLNVLGEIIGQDSNIHTIDGRITGAELRGDAVLILLEDGRETEAGFVAAADGASPCCVEAAGIGGPSLVLSADRRRAELCPDDPAWNVSTEFHTPTGPFTQVPLPGQRSSLVWVQAPAEAEAFLALSPEEISRRIETRMQSMLGKVTWRRSRKAGRCPHDRAAVRQGADGPDR